MRQLQIVSDSERFLTPARPARPSYEKQGLWLCQNKSDFDFIPSPAPPAPQEATAEAVLHQAPALAGVPGGAQRGVSSNPHKPSTARERRWLAALSPSQLDVTNSLPMTSPARYSVPESSEWAEDSAGGDRFGEKDFSAKAGKYFSQLLFPQSKPATELPAAALGCGSDTRSIAAGLRCWEPPTCPSRE